MREQRFKCRHCNKEFTKIYIFENEHLVLRTKCRHCGSTDLQPVGKTSEKLQAEFSEKVKKMNQSRTSSQRNRPA